jgi:hypothetical protein
MVRSVLRHPFEYSKYPKPAYLMVRVPTWVIQRELRDHLCYSTLSHYHKKRVPRVRYLLSRHLTLPLTLLPFSEQGLQAARNALSRAQKDTQDSFMRYTACLDVERQARQAVGAAERRRDDISMSSDLDLRTREF